MIQLHVDVLQNLQQAIFVFDIPSTADCNLQTDQVIIENEEQHCQNLIHLNGLIIDINKGSEINTKVNGEGQITRTFKFPFLRLPKITDNIVHDLTKITCTKCSSPLTLLLENQSYEIVQQQNTNADDINEVIYCHRFCEAHQHEHEQSHQHQQLHIPLNLHSKPIVLETTECFTISKEYISSNLIINNDLIQCNHCSSRFGSFDPQTNLISLDKCSLLPFSNEYLSSCFRHHEPGRYIVKVPKLNDSVFLVWILPNQILSANASINSTDTSTDLNFHRMRKVLFTHVTSSDNHLFNEWKRDFSVTTLLVNRLCLDHLSTAFTEEMDKFPNTINTKEPFQSLTISC